MWFCDWFKGYLVFYLSTTSICAEQLKKTDGDEQRFWAELLSQYSPPNFSAVVSKLLKVGIEYVSCLFVQIFCRGPGFYVTMWWWKEQAVLHFTKHTVLLFFYKSHFQQYFMCIFATKKTKQSFAWIVVWWINTLNNCTIYQQWKWFGSTLYFGAVFVMFSKKNSTS